MPLGKLDILAAILKQLLIFLQKLTELHNVSQCLKNKINKNFFHFFFQESPPIDTMNDNPNHPQFLDDFFSPLRENPEAETLSFPGFGFWSRKYASELESNFQHFADLLNDRESVCALLQKMAANTAEMCPMKWDSLSCFPATEVGQLSIIPCPKYIKGVPYDTTRKYFPIYFQEKNSPKVTRWR